MGQECWTYLPQLCRMTRIIPEWHRSSRAHLNFSYKKRDTKFIYLIIFFYVVKIDTLDLMKSNGPCLWLHLTLKQLRKPALSPGLWTVMAHLEPTFKA